MKPNSRATALPLPDDAALLHSGRLLSHVRTLMTATRDGVIPFADFMRALLYAPGLGYYTAGATKFGAAGDFVTAPELSSLFGATLAQLFGWSDESVTELGAGSGKLAEDFLNHAVAAPYQILEVSADLRERQQQRLAGRAVRWLDHLPPVLNGVVIANEVLDAVPCEVVRFSAGAYEQGCVAWNDQTAALTWAWRTLPDSALRTVCEQRVPAIDGYVTEVNPEAEGLVSSLCERLQDGVLCLIDYGFSRSQYYLPERRAGTLACHYRQHVHFDPFWMPGLQDVTAHVDFTAMAEAAVDAGAEMLCYSSQAAFLLQGGLLNLLEQRSFASERERIVETGAVQKLLSPTEMGELFKVLVVGKGAAVERLAALSACDQSFRL